MPPLGLPQLSLDPVPRSGVYQILNIVTGKTYVGSSADIKTRWRQHRNGLKANRHGNARLQNSYNKHGVKAFEYFVIERCTPNELIPKEQFWMDALNVINRGYNIHPLARSGLGAKRSKEVRKAISIARTGTKMSDEAKAHLSRFWVGRIISDETKRKMKIGCANRPKASAETKKKIGNAHSGEKSRFYGKPAWNKGMPGFFKGRKHSDEAKAKLRAVRTKKPIMVDGEKRFECSRCRGVFVPALFSRDKYKANGITSDCKKCRNMAVRRRNGNT